MFYSPKMGIWGYLTFEHLKVFIECIVHLTFYYQVYSCQLKLCSHNLVE